MYKLQGQTLTPGTLIVPESMPLNLTERTSSASIILGPDAPSLAVGDWILDDGEPGAASCGA